MIEILIIIIFLGIIAFNVFSANGKDNSGANEKKDTSKENDPKVILPYLPDLKEAVVEREFYFDKYFGMLLSNIECNGPMNYHYIFLVFKAFEDGSFSLTPLKCYAAELNVEGEPVIYFGSFVEELQKPYDVYHINYGINNDLRKIDNFFDTCMSMAIKELNLNSKLKYQITEKVFDEKNIRKMNDILTQYNISEEEFQTKYDSYKRTFEVVPDENDRTGFIGMFDHDFIHDFQTLSDDERKKGLFSTNQRIINRVITSLDSRTIS